MYIGNLADIALGWESLSTDEGDHLREE